MHHSGKGASSPFRCVTLAVRPPRRLDESQQAADASGRYVPRAVPQALAGPPTPRMAWREHRAGKPQPPPTGRVPGATCGDSPGLLGFAAKSRRERWTGRPALEYAALVGRTSRETIMARQRRVVAVGVLLGLLV